MKRLSVITLTLGTLLSMASISYGAPFIITDAVDATTVTSCSATVDNVEKATTLPAAGVGKVYCAVDMGTGVTAGTHTVVVKYHNVWGSTSSGPFTFAKTLPATPSNIRLSVDLTP